MSKEQVEAFKKNPMKFGMESTKNGILQLLSGFFMDFNALWVELMSPNCTPENASAILDALEISRHLTSQSIQEFVENDPEINSIITEIMQENKNNLN